MKDIKICGIGCISAVGVTIDEVWNNLWEETEDTKRVYDCEYEFSTGKKVNRKSDRNSRMMMYVVDTAKEDASFYPMIKIDQQRIGTIYSSSYGSLSTNIKFAEKVLEKNPEFCRPTQFTNTVANASLGYTCIEHGYTGVSTMMLDSNNIGYSMVLLKEEKADVIFSGVSEEYNQERFESIRCYEPYKHRNLAEAAITFAMTSLNIEEIKYYCTIGAFAQMNCGLNPYFHTEPLDEVNKECMKRCIQNCLNDAKLESVDYVITSDCPTSAGEAEFEIIDELLPFAKPLHNIKHYFGETFSCSFQLNIMVAALCLKNQQIPDCFLHMQDKQISDGTTFMVNGFSASGNFMTIVLYR